MRMPKAHHMGLGRTAHAPRIHHTGLTTYALREQRMPEHQACAPAAPHARPRGTVRTPAPRAWTSALGALQACAQRGASARGRFVCSALHAKSIVTTLRALVRRHDPISNYGEIGERGYLPRYIKTLL